MIELPKIVKRTIYIINNGEAFDWSCRFIFLLWISLLIQCPFDLKRVFRGDFEEFSIGFIDEIVRNNYLKGSGEKSAAVLMANLLKRPSETEKLSNFLNWSTFQQGSEHSIGILMTLVQLGKAADDSVLKPHIGKINEIITKTKTVSADSITLNKLIIKIQARIAQIEVKSGNQVQLNSYLSALKHRDTTIRWTAAKSLRRILSSNTAENVFKTLLLQLNSEFNAPIETSPHALHGLFLAIGQLLNYRLILELDNGHKDLFVENLIRGLRFDQIKGSYAIGSFVRDAACYVTWSLARYSNNLIKNQEDDHKIISGLTCMALFDRENSGRRAASAALQEFIGRIGAERQGPFLLILTHVHFFSVVSLEKSFRSNSLEIAKEVPQIVPDLISHLLQVSLFNFDKNIRKLAAETLGDLYKLTDTYEEDLPLRLIKIYEESDDIFAIHGALLSMAALPVVPKFIEISLQSHRIPTKSLGADLLLDGYLRLISSVSIKSTTSNESIEENLKGWLQAITLGLKSRSDDLRTTATIALQSISSQYGSLMDNFYLSCLTGVEKERDVNYQKGLLAALSTSPETFFSKHGNVLIKLLLKTSKTTVPINDIEKRCVAIDSLDKLLQVFENIDLDPIKECLISALLCDYSIDERGDVGSKIRLAALKLSKNFVKSPEIDDLILEQAFGRLDKLRIHAIKSFTRNEPVEVEEFAAWLLRKNSEIPLKGAFRGLIFTCGGLDPEISNRSAEIIKLFITKWGSSEFEEVALSAINDERLCIPSILSVKILNSILSNDFMEKFSNLIIDSIILKSSNIRKLIPSFTLLIHVNKVNLIGKYSAFLEDQCVNHKFPTIRQLVFESKHENNTP